MSCVSSGLAASPSQGLCSRPSVLSLRLTPVPLALPRAWTCAQGRESPRGAPLSLCRVNINPERLTGAPGTSGEGRVDGEPEGGM